MPSPPYGLSLKPHERPAYWSRPQATLLTELDTSPRGLSTQDAEARLRKVGANLLRDEHRFSGLRIFLSQFKSPLVLILVAAAAISTAVGEWKEATIITAVILASSLLSFYQEYSASLALQQLKERISFKVKVWRDGGSLTLPASVLVPGDVIDVAAGDLIPADAVVIEATDLHVSQSVLTGETFPVEKSAGETPAQAPLAQRSNMLFAGASVRSGIGRAVVVATGSATEYGMIAGHLQLEPPETDFARGIRRFGYMVTRITLIMVVVIFAGNLLLNRPLIDSLLFALAIAVGLTPEMLPAIVSVTLSSGARRMAKDGVIVRRLASIENLGGMTLLCTDKTGTLTEGVVRLERVEGAFGGAPAQLMRLAALNARLQNGMANPLDEAIAAAATEMGIDTSGDVKVAEIPYDFLRKRLSVIVQDQDTACQVLIAKGAVANMLDICDTVEDDGKTRPFDANARAVIESRFAEWSEQGYRVLGLATRRFEAAPASYHRDSETALTFIGFLLFSDPPKPGIVETLSALARRGIAVKVITGDNRFVAAHLARSIGLATDHILTGEELGHTSYEALAALAARTDLFVEIDPNQKQRIVAALRRRGHVVGYLGDGINDAPALHEADIGISVEGAADVAQQAADMVLVDKNLDVLLEGVDNGRRTFANTLKYISTTTSANFGNMISMSVASFVLPFQPLLAKQILLNNFLSDIPSLAIASDNVDKESVLRPQSWDIGYVQRFMVVFGLISTVFDILTFGFLIMVARETAAIFQTAWFVESLITELAIVLVIRTAKPVWKSRPGRWLILSTVAVIILALFVPYLPGAGWFGFVALPPHVLAGLGVITLLYLAASELAKHWFFSSVPQHKSLRRQARSRRVTRALRH
ncbi:MULTISPECIES: magnesium-translocating P-type ATPase [Alphaproteobacteria]|uniref:Magnesium-transporting ATPase, P-type 1 n=2 Tax=Alphaproteobacteria TaxID=28211 RepID=A0A512HKX2_9HYPH|nr:MULTISPECIES: magnesium-translocating P-type ATPase [Alphaproteobacteria]GEO86050.1 magnesium-translocating P-type ATPase [Ciceribacter naphthalenivorans]GLR22137.1 magnesium-translocating P-type ATPase [Ciceribacter naphthalenivorans]GLT04993.1 magnesium-translocating P-type ATPase [Sphingomonas psychrolutea]